MKDPISEIERLKAENASLRSEVHEWLCKACATIYPGPPQPGLMCVICPKCEGPTGPRLSLENASLLESLRAVKDGLHHAETRLVEMCARWTDAQAQIDSARYVVEKARDCERAEQRARATEKEKDALYDVSSSVACVHHDARGPLECVFCKSWAIRLAAAEKERNEARECVSLAMEDGKRGRDYWKGKAAAAEKEIAQAREQREKAFASAEDYDAQARAAEQRLAEEHDLLNQALDRCNELSGEVLASHESLADMRREFAAAEQRAEAAEKERDEAFRDRTAIENAAVADTRRLLQTAAVLREARDHLRCLGWNLSGGTDLRDRVDAALAGNAAIATPEAGLITLAEIASGWPAKHVGEFYPEDLPQVGPADRVRAVVDSLAMVEAACARALAGDKDRRSLVATLTLVIERTQEMRAALHDEERSAPPLEDDK